MKTVYNIDPVHEFGQELEFINSDLHREIAIKSLFKAPDYFWYAPASSSGKYHPKSSLGVGGLVRHTKSAFAISEELLQHPMYGSFEDDEKDCIRVAILLHDVVKQGTDVEGGHTVFEHPLLVRNTVCPWDDGEFATLDMFSAWDTICSLIETHMGVWTSNRQGEEILECPRTEMQRFVHLADYLASRKCIEVDFYDRKPQSRVVEDWRDKEAKQTQIDYIAKLMRKCGEQGIQMEPIEVMKNGKVVLRRGEASDLIKVLKEKVELF